MQFIWLLVLFAFVNAIVSTHSKVQLGNVNVLTLRKDQYTTGRRGPSVLQLNCVGGSARSESHKVETVQCTNTGFDGRDYNWKCQSELPSNLKLGKTTVSCEGYDFPDDPYVLVGSCGLEYNLDYTTTPVNQNVHHKHHQQHQTVHQTTTYDHSYTHPLTFRYTSSVANFIVGLMSLMICLALFSWFCSLFVRQPRVVTHSYPTHTTSVIPTTLLPTSVIPTRTVGPMDHYVVTQPSSTSSFVDGVLVGSVLSSRPTHSHTHTTTTIDNGCSSYGSGNSLSSGLSSFGSGNSSSGSNSTNTSTSFADTKRR